MSDWTFPRAAFLQRPYTCCCGRSRRRQQGTRLLCNYQISPAAIPSTPPSSLVVEGSSWLWHDHGVQCSSVWHVSVPTPRQYYHGMRVNLEPWRVGKHLEMELCVVLTLFRFGTLWLAVCELLAHTYHPTVSAVGIRCLVDSFSYSWGISTPWLSTHPRH